jgi:hypothetical protein
MPPFVAVLEFWFQETKILISNTEVTQPKKFKEFRFGNSGIRAGMQFQIPAGGAKPAGALVFVTV